MAEYYSAADIKKNYYETLVEENKLDTSERIKNANEYDIIYDYESLHPEEVASDKKMNKAFYEAGLDIISIDNEIAMLAQDYNDLLVNYEERIELIDQNIRIEKSRLEDYNLISGKYGFDYYVDLKNTNFLGNFDYYDNGEFSAYSSQAVQIEIKMTSITGNGYAGNKYAYRNETFLSDINDTSNYEYPFDGNLNTYFEYSRICTSSKENIAEDIHYDDEDCECSIVIESSSEIKMFNTMQIGTELSSLVLKRIDVSYDEGKSFITYHNEDIQISDTETKYTSATNHSYTVITFPDTNVVRLTFKSSAHLIEQLVNKMDDDTIEFIKNAERKVILLNEITAYNSIRVESQMVSDTFSINNAHDIAIYSEEKIYGSDEIENSIEYVLNINGSDYPIVPINAERDGIQLIKTSDFEYYNPKATIISDKISEAYLTVNFTPVSESKTGFCKNIKICVRY